MKVLLTKKKKKRVAFILDYFFEPKLAKTLLIFFQIDSYVYSIS